MAQDKCSFRMVHADVWPRLQGTSALAQAVYFRLACGPDAAPFPVAPLRMAALASDLDVSTQALRPAIKALVARGLLVLDVESTPSCAYLPLRMRRELPRSPDQQKAWSRLADGYQWASFHLQLVEDMKLTPPTPGGVCPPTPPPHKGTTTETDTETDTNTISVNRLAAAEAAAQWDELFADKPQASRGKPKGDSATAILHRRLASEACAIWQREMVPPNVAVQPDARWQKMHARNVAQTVAALGNIEYFTTMCRYAKDNLPYHAGLPYGPHAQVRRWTLPEFCARQNIEKIHAAVADWAQRELGRPTRIILDWSRKPSEDQLAEVQR